MADKTDSSVMSVELEFNTVELPPSIEIRESSVRSGEAGAFSKTLISKDTRFGPYKGEIISPDQKCYIDFRFAWEVFEKNSNVLKYTISGMNPKTSNWMRHVNCARFYEEQNILSVQDGFSIFYVAMKDIKPGEELLTWFDPKLLKRSQRRLSKMERKPVGYTIELVPWSEEKKFVPEIIETKRARKKKVLSDMICLDEDPLAITRTLQSLPKVPCTPKQLAQSSIKGSSAQRKCGSLEPSPRSATEIKKAEPAPKAKRGRKPKNLHIIKFHQTNSSQACGHVGSGNNANVKSEVSQGSTADETIKTSESPVKVKKKRGRKKLVDVLRKGPVKLGRPKLQRTSDGEIIHDERGAIKPVVIKHKEDGTTVVEDHDETYTLRNIQLRQECDEQCSCLDKQQAMNPHSHSPHKGMQNAFVIFFTLLPEHKSSSPDNKIIYKCDVCDSAYNHAFSLKRHYLSVHINHRYLSRDDIHSCQIETFHTGVQLERVEPQISNDTKASALIKMEEPTAVQSKKPALTAVNISEMVLSDSSIPHSSTKTHMNVADEDDKHLLCEETLADDEEKDSNSNFCFKAEALHTVPALAKLAQICVDHTRKRSEAASTSNYAKKPSSIRKVSRNNTESGDFRLECDESLSADLLCPTESEKDSAYMSKTNALPVISNISSQNMEKSDASKISNLMPEESNLSNNNNITLNDNQGCSDFSVTGQDRKVDLAGKNQEAATDDMLLQLDNPDKSAQAEKLARPGQEQVGVLDVIKPDMAPAASLQHMSQNDSSEGSCVCQNGRVDKSLKTQERAIISIRSEPLPTETTSNISASSQDFSMHSSQNHDQGEINLTAEMSASTLTNNSMSSQRNVLNKDSMGGMNDKMSANSQTALNSGHLDSGQTDSVNKVQGQDKQHNDQLFEPTAMSEDSDQICCEKNVKRDVDMPEINAGTSEGGEKCCLAGSDKDKVESSGSVVHRDVEEMDVDIKMNTDLPTSATIADDAELSKEVDTITLTLRPKSEAMDTVETSVKPCPENDPCELISEKEGPGSVSTAEHGKQSKLQSCSSEESSASAALSADAVSSSSSENSASFATTATLSTPTKSMAPSQPPQQVIFVTNIVFPIVSPTPKQPSTSSSLPSSTAPQGTLPSKTATPNPLTTQAAGLPLVLISQLPHGLNVQNAANAFLQSSTALKTLQTIQNSLNVVNLGNTATRLSTSSMSAGKSPASSSQNSKSGTKLSGHPPSVTSVSSPTNCMTPAFAVAQITSSAGSGRKSPSKIFPVTEKPEASDSSEAIKPDIASQDLSFSITSALGHGPQQNQSTSSPPMKITPSDKITVSSTGNPIRSTSPTKSSMQRPTSQPDDLYRCHMCVLLFKTMNELKHHIKHDPHRFKGGIKQYACVQCSMRFSNKNNLMRHNLMNHPESENYKFRCFTCGKGFTSETYLKMHARFHTGKNFPCKYGCVDVCFPNAASLVKHLRTQHAGLNLKEYLRNAKAEKAHRKKLNRLFGVTDEQITSLGIDGKSSGKYKTGVTTPAPYSINQPGIGFQAKRGRPKGSKNAVKHPKPVSVRYENEKFKTEQTMASELLAEEPQKECEIKPKFHFTCKLCQKGFTTYLKLLQHRTRQHGVSESVQEYLYQMSKCSRDDELSETESVKLEFSPPPSPKTFFANVNRRGHENMKHYIDGHSETLKFWRKHVKFEDYVSISEPLPSSIKPQPKLEWTFYNFPPCFHYKEDCTRFYDENTAFIDNSGSHYTDDNAQKENLARSSSKTSETDGSGTNPDLLCVKSEHTNPAASEAWVNDSSTLQTIPGKQNLKGEGNTTDMGGQEDMEYVSGRLEQHLLGQGDGTAGKKKNLQKLSDCDRINDEKEKKELDRELDEKATNLCTHSEIDGDNTEFAGTLSTSNIDDGVVMKEENLDQGHEDSAGFSHKMRDVNKLKCESTLHETVSGIIMYVKSTDEQHDVHSTEISSSRGKLEALQPRLSKVASSIPEEIKNLRMSPTQSLTEHESRNSDDCRKSCSDRDVETCFSSADSGFSSLASSASTSLQGEPKWCDAGHISGQKVTEHVDTQESSMWINQEASKTDTRSSSSNGSPHQYGVANWTRSPATEFDGDPNFSMKKYSRSELKHKEEAHTLMNKHGAIAENSSWFTQTSSLSAGKPAELPLNEKLELLKRPFIQGMNIESKVFDSFRARMDFGKASVLDCKDQRSVSFLLKALDLHVVGGRLSSEKLLELAETSVLKLCSPMVGSRQRTLSLPSLGILSLSKRHHKQLDRTLDTSLNTSDVSKHDHRRYSIWTGQVNHKSDQGNKEEICCCPVVEAVRKQETMQWQEKYEFERLARKKEMNDKDSEKVGRMEILGLTSRRELELSPHIRKQEEFIIKPPEVWENYENIWFGKKGTITVVCSICHRHFSCWDLCLRHQLKKHPHIEPSSLEMERDNFVEDMYYYYPMQYGILAQTQLIPDNLPPPEVYVCTRCGFPFKNLSKLHSHIITCDPVQEEAMSSQNSSQQKPSFMKKKLLPIMDRRMSQNPAPPPPRAKVGRPFKKAPAVNKDSESENKSVTNYKKRTIITTLPAAPDHKPSTSMLQSRSNFSSPFSFYTGRRRKNYELLYNPQNHIRRRELYKVLDQHQCHGCNLKFKSLSLLERHVKKCSGKDKLRSQKPLLSGIMPDDAAMRKQHTCRYCNKRFTYIKGVDLHYKRICAVRKVKEEENQLTAEDYAHEAELKRIIEHIKWSKSLNKDSSDIIQGHVRVEEDGTLTRLVKKRGWPRGLKKKVKKKGFKWTTLKKHRPDDEVSLASSTASSLQDSPNITAEVVKAVEDRRYGENSDQMSDTAGGRRLTRSTSLEMVQQTSTEDSHKRRVSALGSGEQGGKVRRTVSQSSSTNLMSKDDSRSSQSPPETKSVVRTGRRGRPKKYTPDNSPEKQTCKKVGRRRTSTKDKKTDMKDGTSSNSVSKGAVAQSTTNDTVTAVKPPARKRGRPKKFDPDEMESSYKKKKPNSTQRKCDNLEQNDDSKGETVTLRNWSVSSIDKGGSLASTRQPRSKVQASNVKDDYVYESPSVKKKLRDKEDICPVFSDKEKVGSSVSKLPQTMKKDKVVPSQSSEMDHSKMMEKMKQLKDAAKLEVNKSSHSKKLSAHTSHGQSSSSTESKKPCDPVGKIGTEDQNDHKVSKSSSKLPSSSELFKHLTQAGDKLSAVKKIDTGATGSSKEKLINQGAIKCSPAVTAGSLKRKLSSDEVKSTPPKQIKITSASDPSRTSVTSSAIPATKPTINIKSNVSVSQGTGKTTLVFEKVVKMPESLEKIEPKSEGSSPGNMTDLPLTSPGSASLAFLQESTTTSSGGKDSAPSAASVPKQPKVSVKVVTLSPNRTNLLTYDSVASIPTSTTTMVSAQSSAQVSPLLQGTIQTVEKNSNTITQASQNQASQYSTTSHNSDAVPQNNVLGQMPQTSVPVTLGGRFPSQVIVRACESHTAQELSMDEQTQPKPPAQVVYKDDNKDQTEERSVNQVISEYENGQDFETLRNEELKSNKPTIKWVHEQGDNTFIPDSLKRGKMEKSSLGEGQKLQKSIGEGHIIYVGPAGQVVSKPSHGPSSQNTSQGEVTLLCTAGQAASQKLQGARYNQKPVVSQTQTSTAGHGRQKQISSSATSHTTVTAGEPTHIQIRGGQVTHKPKPGPGHQVPATVVATSVEQIHFISPSKLMSSTIPVSQSCGRSACLPTSVSVVKSQGTVPAIIMPSTTVRLPSASTNTSTPTAVSRLTSPPTRFASPTKLVTLTGTIIPNIVQGNAIQAGGRMLKLGNVPGTSSSQTSAHIQVANIPAHGVRAPASSRVIPAIVTQRPLLLNAGQLPRVIAPGIRLQRPVLQSAISRYPAGRSQAVTVTAHQAGLVARPPLVVRPALPTSQQILIQQPNVKSMVTIPHPQGMANTETMEASGSKKAADTEVKQPIITLPPSTLQTNQIMFSLDDGTTAMLDPDSLAQFLSISPSLNKSELNTTVPNPGAALDPESTMVNMAEIQPHQQTVNDIMWPSNGSVDLTELPDSTCDY